MFLSYLLVGDYDGLLIEYECYSPMNQLEQAQTIHLSDMFHLSCRRYNPCVTVKGHIFVMDYYCEMNGNYPFYADIGDVEFVP